MKTFVTMQKLCEVIEKRIINKFDLIIFVEGKRGMGKSTFLYLLALRLNKRGVIKFNPKKHLVYSRDQSIKSLSQSQKCFILNDEMINVAYNRDFYEQDQKILLKALNNYRDSCNIFGGCVPKFIDLDKQMQKLCEMRVQIHRRGIAEVHGQLKGFYLDDPWNTKENIKKELKTKGKPKTKMNTQRFFVRFKDLTSKQRQFYEALKHERRNKVFMGDNEIEQDPNEIFYNNLYQTITNGQVTKEQLDTMCRVLNKKIRTVRDQMNKRLREDLEATESLQYYLNLAESNRIKRQKEKKKIKIMAVAGGQEEELTKDNNELFNDTDKRPSWSDL